MTEAQWITATTQQAELIKRICLGAGEVAPPHSPTRGAGAGAADAPRRGRRLGSAVGFGHKSWGVVVQMMVGIRLALGHAADDLHHAEAEQRASRMADAGLSSADLGAISAISLDDEPLSEPGCLGLLGGCVVLRGGGGGGRGKERLMRGGSKQRSEAEPGHDLVDGKVEPRFNEARDLARSPQRSRATLPPRLLGTRHVARAHAPVRRAPLAPRPQDRHPQGPCRRPPPPRAAPLPRAEPRPRPLPAHCPSPVPCGDRRLARCPSPPWPP